MSNDRLFVKIMITLTFLAGLLSGIAIGLEAGKSNKCSYQRSDNFISSINSPLFVKDKTMASISAYNSVPEQTDNTPCLGAGGHICGRDDVVANNCLPIGTMVQIDGKIYEVYDRMNSRYGCEYFDIYMGMDVEGAIEFGRQYKEVIILQ
jgi:hypothetical protein